MIEIITQKNLYYSNYHEGSVGDNENAIIQMPKLWKNNLSNTQTLWKRNGNRRSQRKPKYDMCKWTRLSYNTNTKMLFDAWLYTMDLRYSYFLT